MKAAVLRAPGDLVVTDADTPECGASDIVVKVAATGICGSDLASFATGAYVRPMQVMGHEFVGTVEAVGDHVAGIHRGERVTVRPLGQCGSCQACLLGLRHVCERAVRDAIGYGHPGAFAEFVRVPNAVADANVFVLDDTVDDATAATIEPFAVALRACSRLAVEASGTAVVLGLGPVGLAAVQVLRATGVRNVVGIDNSALRRETATRFGAAEVADFSGMLDAVRSLAGPGPRGRGAGADAVLEASGAEALLSAGVGLLRSGGRLGMVALYKQPIALDMNELVARELEVVGCYGYDAEFGDVVRYVSEGRIDPGSLVTATYPLDSIVSAFAAQADTEHHVKVHVRP